ncbi:hypothetical protein [Embleya scabrispora]|uniref:hypothetical protein n=1 Tax=Embleya scabrispora TaxID=159449 RepID=UPI000365896E|nr:hypothetical protein [Embleya scabrispora]MYS85022.1 hypothetical protein [Streptomyces sp. SID5474]
MSTRVVRRSIRRVALPLTALVLVAGLSACESDTGDADKANPKAGATRSGKPGDAEPPTDKSVDTSADPKAPQAKAPATKAQLTAALLNAQELPAGLTVKETVDPEQSEIPTVSDPRCQPLVGQRRTSVATIERDLVGGTDPQGVVQPDTDVVLSSFRSDLLDSQWTTYIAAAKSCKRFTFRIDAGTVEYQVLDVRIDAYGPGSIEISSMLRVQGATAPFTQAIARVGTTVVQLRASGEDGTTTAPTFPDHLVRGQIDKVRSELGG